MPGSPDRAPVGRPTLIERPRLVERLAERFRRRLTLVVGGGGSGKSTLLSQMAGEHGVDVLHSCTVADRTPGRLLAGLTEATAGRLGAAGGDEDPTVASLVELVLAQSPRHVCLVVDDVHHLDRLDLVDELLTALPANGHLLLCGRRRPVIDTARLDASGELIELATDDLLMTTDELIEFANARGVDLEVLEGAEGWPAFVELAAAGSTARSRRYLEEEALRAIAPERRRSLARFALVRGGDDAIAGAVTDQPLDELLAELPLVAWDGDRARLHDLWGEVLDDELTEADRLDAALAAASVWRARGDYDAAIDLTSQVGRWDESIATIAEAISTGVDGGLRVEQLRRWSRILPDHTRDDPVVVLMQGLIHREIDPTSSDTWDALSLAAEGFRAADRPALELVALLQLGYVARIGGDPLRLGPVMERAARLAGHHPPARPFLAFGDAWTALAQGRPDRQLTAMESIVDADLPPVWRNTRDHLIAHALFNLGRPREALERVPTELLTQRVPVPGALTTETQCLWMAGRPDEALRLGTEIAEATLGARDRFIASAWLGTMLAYTGDAPRADAALAEARSAAGEQPSPLVMAQISAMELLIGIARGRDDEVAVELGGLLELIPLGEGVSEQFLRNNLVIPYVLVPASRTYWDETPLGPSIVEARELAAAFVSAREGDDGPLRRIRLPEPGVVACHFPCPWAIELALRRLHTRQADGRRLAAWLAERWGEPARAALRSWTDDDALGSVAQEVLASTPSPPIEQVTLRLLGPVDVRIDGRSSDDPDLRRERVRALLTVLALRPDTTRDQLAGLLWPDLATDRAGKNLRTTLAYVHGVIEPHRSPGDAPWFVRTDGQQIRLHGSLDVDLWRFRDELDRADDAERAGRPQRMLPLLLTAIERWHGDLAADLDHDWLDLERIHLRSRYVRACCRAAELLVALRDPTRAIAMARRALDVDRWSDAAHASLADAYDAIGDRTSARAVRARLEALGAES